jgi:hypothetical protein
MSKNQQLNKDMEFFVNKDTPVYWQFLYSLFLSKASGIKRTFLWGCFIFSLPFLIPVVIQTSLAVKSGFSSISTAIDVSNEENYKRKENFVKSFDTQVIINDIAFVQKIIDETQSKALASNPKNKDNIITSYSSTISQFNSDTSHINLLISAATTHNSEIISEIDISQTSQALAQLNSYRYKNHLSSISSYTTLLKQSLGKN